MTFLKEILPAVMLLILLAFPASGRTEEPAASSGPALLDELVEMALKNNPDLHAAEDRWRMFDRKTFPAGSLDDPTLSFSMINYPVDTLDAGETPMTGNELKLSQKLPFPGKLAAREKIAEEEARWYEGQYRDARLQLIRQVKETWYQLFYQDQAVETTLKNIDLLDDFIRLTESRYEVGQGLQQDVLKAQVERSKLMDQQFTLEQRREALQADLNTLLARPSGTPVETPSELTMTPVGMSLEEMQEKSEEHRPLFASYASLVDRFRAQRRLSKLDYRPDFNVWAGYRFREEVPGDPVDGTDFISGGISINLPIWQRKRSEAVAEAESGTRMALRQFDDFRNKVYFTIHDVHSQLEKNRKLVDLYKGGIIPQANQSLQATMSSYQVGDVDFLNLIDSQLTLYNYEIEYYRALTDHERDVARLEAATGIPLGGQAGKERESDINSKTSRESR